VGLDAAGTVIAVGEGVTAFKVGDRVAASVREGYAEILAADASSCGHIPAGMDFAQAAGLPCAALTGVQAIEDEIKPRKGQTVLITGATGAVGRFVLLAALAAGVRVVAAVRPAYFDEARALGAHVVIPLEGADTSGLAFDHVADTVGGPAVAALCRFVAAGGAICTVATTPIDPAGLPSTPKFFVYRHDGTRLEKIMHDVASGVASMPVARKLPLASAPEAHRLMEAGGIRGKIVLEL
jgi:NADPH2:quinone reductase